MKITLSVERGCGKPRFGEAPTGLFLSERPPSDPMRRGRRKHWWSPMRYENGHYRAGDGRWVPDPTPLQPTKPSPMIGEARG